MRLLPALALTGALLMGACTNPDGSLNVPATLAVGAGAAIAGVAIAAASDDGPRHRGYHRGHGRSYGYDRGYRREAYGYGGYGYPHHRRW
jgi:uncharacterized membrane protein